MHFRPLRGVAADHRAGEAAGERLQLVAQCRRGGFDEYRDLAEIDLPAPREGLHRVEDPPAGEPFGQGREGYAARRVGHRGSVGYGQPCGDLPHGAVADGDEVQVGPGEPPRVVRPLRAGECGHLAAPCGVAREELHEAQPVGRRHGPGEGFRQVSASDDCDLFHGCFVSASFIRSVSVTLSSALRAASLSPSSSRSICASSGVAARSKEVCPLRSTASRML